MAHRSDQAVASQGQAAPQPPDAGPPPHRRLLIGWATALAALGVSTFTLAGGLWLVRYSIAEFMIGAALAERGADASFQVTALELDHAVLSGVRFGPETAPDAAAQAVEARWRWRGLLPELMAVRVIEPRLRVRIEESGRVNAGTLNQIRGQPSARRAAIPAIRLDIVDGQALIEAPFGALTARFEGAGVLGADFTGAAQITETSHAGQDFALDRGTGDLAIVSRDGALAFRLSASAGALRWREYGARGAALRASGRAPLDFATYELEAAWRADQVTGPRLAGENVTGAIGAEAAALSDALDPDVWTASAHANAGRLEIAGNVVRNARLDADANGRERVGRGRWALTAAQFDGLALISQQPAAAGQFSLDMSSGGDVDATATITLAQSRFDPRAQARLREAFPDIPQAPIGPTFAAAERALDAAADRFDLSVPLTFAYDSEGARLVVTQPIVLQAASGVSARLTPLRPDGPALTLQWRGLQLRGALALELSGGGAPTATALIDGLAWAPDAPFHAEGTLALTNWRAGGAEIAAEELAISLLAPAEGESRLEVAGAARITGPLGAGEVRDMIADLDLDIFWGGGWRVAPSSGCVPVRLGGLDAAGLSFVGGAFSLCAVDNALIAANTQGRLSGGFAIERLVLNGRMAGEAAQPARLGASRIVGRFSGVSGDTVLNLEATAPRLAIDMAEGRTLDVVLQRMTAQARITDTWRVEGAFEHGGLTDPTLPGGVSAIAGRWSAFPQDDQPVIQMSAGEALLTANRPASDAERPLFNPLRLINVNATLRGGQVAAEGGVVLAETLQSLASFAARHSVEEGFGGADIRAPRLMFDESLQPYQITELARGLVENVRGEIGLEAAILWTRDAISSSGVVHLNGVSLATATIPIVEDVRGDVLFDDFFALTTPPGQVVNVGVLNPGVAVRDGRVQFQLLQDGGVRIEGAEFAFASGVLSMTPTTITLGADETQFELRLSDVDAAALLAQLNVPDLSATGRIEGRFPLLLTRTHAYIRDGSLRAQAPGGAISYTGEAGASAEGPARVAFDALRDFRYDALSLTLNGDLAGEVVSEINFSGENSGRAIDLGPIASAPGVGRVTVRGVPFVFNVQVRAPFRRLAETAASLTNPSELIERGREQEQTPPPVDQSPPEPR